MTRRPRRFRGTYLVAASLAFLLFGGATVGWARSRDADAFGLRFGSQDVPGSTHSRAHRPARTPDAADDVGDRSQGGPALPARPGLRSTGAAPAAPGAAGARRPMPTGQDAGAVPPDSGDCRTGAKLVPTCGVLWGVAPGARTSQTGTAALRDFEAKTGRHQDIFHGYHKGIKAVFPTREEIAIARQPGKERILFLNWKPRAGSWAKIAKGDPAVDRYLDRLAEHLKKNFTEDFFFTVHHEAEDNVREKPGSGWTARDYAAMYRHVVQRLRGHGVRNLVTVMVHMAYVPYTSKDWFERMYPGNDVVDWIGFDTYAYSDPGYGHGDFAELLNRRGKGRSSWPGFYNWASTRHPNKPLVVAEWGVWSSKKNPGHKADFYREVGRQIARFPRIKAMVHFDTPSNQDGRDSRVDATPEALKAYRRLGSLPVFQVKVTSAAR